MKISGLQKTTLIDYPEKIACTIFLHGCNFRCGFCYNAELVTGEVHGSYPEDEILYFLDERKDKLNGICITGGEPLLTLKDSFLEKIKEMGYSIKVDTNGTLPKRLKELIEKKLIDYVAMDIKGAKEDYNLITNSSVKIEDIEESIKIISSLKNYEFRTTVLEKFHNPKKIKKMGIWLNELTNKKPKAYYLQGFKNQGNFIEKSYENEKNTTEDFLEELRSSCNEYFENIDLRV